jgi:phage-related protein
MTSQRAEWRIEFYRDRRGKSPPLEYINALPATDRAKVRNDLRLLQEFGVGISPPQAKPLIGHKPLWELRPLPFRLLYFLHTGRRFVILHAFRKKGRKIPPREIATAERRMVDFLERER